MVDQSMRRSMGWAWGTGGHQVSTNSDAALTYGTREIWNFICRTNYSINDMGRWCRRFVSNASLFEETLLA